MKKSLKTLGVIALATGTIMLVGCKPSDFVEGEVIQEYGNIAKMVDSGTPSFDKESLDLKNPFYGLKVKTDHGVYTIEVDADDSGGSSGSHTAYNLAAAIEKGTRIKFATKYDGRKLFAADRIGSVDPDDIIILDEEAQKKPQY